MASPGLNILIMIQVTGSSQGPRKSLFVSPNKDEAKEEPVKSLGPRLRTASPGLQTLIVANVITADLVKGPILMESCVSNNKDGPNYDSSNKIQSDLCHHYSVSHYKGSLL